MTVQDIISRFQEIGNPEEAIAITSIGVKSKKILGVPLIQIRQVANELGCCNHLLALELWNTGFHEARILATMIENPAVVTPEQADKWADDFDSWILCDHCCSSLFWKLPFAPDKALEWTENNAEFIRRAGFALIAALALHLKESDRITLGFLDYSLFSARKHASDSSPHVRKAVSWAIRQIGKRNIKWHTAAVETAEEIRMQPAKEAKWVARQTLADLMSTKILRAVRSEQS